MSDPVPPRAEIVQKLRQRHTPTLVGLGREEVDACLTEAKAPCGIGVVGGDEERRDEPRIGGEPGAGRHVVQ